MIKLKIEARSERFNGLISRDILRKSLPQKWSQISECSNHKGFFPNSFGPGTSNRNLGTDESTRICEEDLPGQE